MARPLRIGFQLPEAERVVRFEEYAAMARAAEASGFDSVWVGDHLLYREPLEPERGPWEAMSLLAALAAVTTTVTIGPLVACLGFRNPAILAKQAATIDEIAAGRFVLGVGAGWNAPDFLPFGLPFEDRAASFLEAFEIVRRLLAGERVTHRGMRYATNDALLLPPPQRRIPLMLGSTGARVLEATLSHVDAWNVWLPWHGNDPAGFATQNERVTRLASERGRDPATIERSACVFVAVTIEPGEEAVDEGVTPLTGSSREIARGLAAFASAGADEVILVSSPANERAIRVYGEALRILDETDVPRRGPASRARH